MLVDDPDSEQEREKGKKKLDGVKEREYEERRKRGGRAERKCVHGDLIRPVDHGAEEMRDPHQIEERGRKEKEERGTE